MPWGVVLDCGSSGTRLHVFNWREAGGRLSEVAPGDAQSMKLEPGISSFVANPAALSAYIDPLLQEALRLVPSGAHASTSLRAYATAGMRLLTVEQQSRIWSVLRDRFDASPFAFKRADAATISGNSEGLFGWIAAHEIAVSAAAPRGAPSHFGMLDLGGASTQVAFAPVGGSIMEDAYRVSRRGATSRVYSHSYMRSGVDQAVLRLAERLHRAPPVLDVAAPLFMPCFNTGHERNVTLCSRDGSACAVRLFRGSGDWDACHALTDAMLHTEYDCLQPPCAAYGVYQPDVTGVSLFATSGFFWMVNGIGLAPMGGSWSGTLDRKSVV